MKNTALAALLGMALAALCVSCDSCSALFRSEGEAGWTTITNSVPPLVRVIGD